MADEGMQDPSSAEEESESVVIPIERTFSDGVQSHWPTGERFRSADDTYYRVKLATLWLKKTGAYEIGVDYILDSLPEGYALIDRPRAKSPDHFDRFLYGHPSNQYFQSAVQFFSHFYYLMTGGSGPCTCALCERQAKRQHDGGGAQRGRPRGRPPGPSSASGLSGTPSGRPVGRPPGSSNKNPGKTPGRPGRPPGRPSRSAMSLVTDEEGTPDVFKMAVMKLQKKGEWDEEITEPLSMDWRAEREGLKVFFQKLDMQPSFLPRSGELVLWTSDFEGELAWNPERKRVEISSGDGKEWTFPEWRAGVVAQVPEEATTLQDIVDTAPKKWPVNYSGFRVETFPDPNSADKSYSLHYKYVHSKSIKPLNAYEVFLSGSAREEWHPSIEFAMTVMSSFSLLDKYRFKGVWPDAAIYCHGIFIGAELLIVGDTVHLKPRGYDPDNAPSPLPTKDVMVIEEIRMELVECDADIESEQLAGKYQVRLRGKVYTTSRQYAQQQRNTTDIKPMTHDEIVNAFNYVGMGGYGHWYAVHPGSVVEVAQNMVTGRIHEPDAVQLMYGNLDFGSHVRGVVKAREYSRKIDARMYEGQDWFWGDCRTETLGLETLNGEDVGYYNESRDPKMWRATLRVLDGIATAADLKDAKVPNQVGRPAGKSQSNFAKVGKLSKLVSTGLGAIESNPASSAEEDFSNQPDDKSDSDSGDGDDDDEEEDEADDFTLRMDQLRGGTEETEGGDYNPDSEPQTKRAKRDE